jgi:hypothetical protein
MIWVQRLEETGGVAEMPSGGSTSQLERHAKFLLDAKQPNPTLDEVVVATKKLGIAESV